MRRAVFLDRDGTIIEHVHYLTDPALVRVLPGAAPALRMLSDAGYLCVVVTNQSVLGRGLITEEGLARVHEAMERRLGEEGASLDAIYHCPHLPATDDRATPEHPDRKPGPGMLLRAAHDREIDLSRSWMVGDMLSDIAAGRAARTKGNVLVRTGLGCTVENGGHGADRVVDDLLAAARWIMSVDESGERTTFAGKER